MPGDRDAQGRFAQGHRLSVGNRGGRPKRSVEETHLRAFRQAMPGKKWLEALANYAEKAVQGDRYAIRFFADYLIGRPLERQLVAHGRMSARQQEILEYMAELYRSMSEYQAEEPPASDVEDAVDG